MHRTPSPTFVETSVPVGALHVAGALKADARVGGDAVGRGRGVNQRQLALGIAKLDQPVLLGCELTNHDLAGPLV